MGAVGTGEAGVMAMAAGVEAVKEAVAVKGGVEKAEAVKVGVGKAVAVKVGVEKAGAAATAAAARGERGAVGTRHSVRQSHNYMTCSKFRRGSTAQHCSNASLSCFPRAGR